MRYAHWLKSSRFLPDEDIFLWSLNASSLLCLSKDSLQLPQWYCTLFSRKSQCFSYSVVQSAFVTPDPALNEPKRSAWNGGHWPTSCVDFRPTLLSRFDLDIPSMNSSSALHRPHSSSPWSSIINYLSLSRQSGYLFLKSRLVKLQLKRKRVKRGKNEPVNPKSVRRSTSWVSKFGLLRCKSNSCSDSQIFSLAWTVG